MKFVFVGSRSQALLTSLMVVAACSTNASNATEHVSRDQISNLLIPGEGQAAPIRLKNGTASVGYGGASADHYSLRDLFAEGRLNGDRHPDAAVILVDDSPGSGTFFSVVPVLSSRKAYQAAHDIFLGDRVVIQRLAIRDRAIEVIVLDRSVDTAYAELNVVRHITIAQVGAIWKITAQTSAPLATVPLPAPDPAPKPLSLPSGSGHAVAKGSLLAGTRQGYLLTQAADHPLHVQLDAPLGVFLDVHDQAGHGLIKPSDQFTALDVVLPQAGDWQIDVVSLNGDTSAYTLTVSVNRELTQPASPAVSKSTIVAAPLTAATGKTLYLTFDDGPSPTYTPQVLALLKQYGARATFFVVGQLVSTYPSLRDAELADGNTIANHTWDHSSLAGMNQAQFNSEVQRTAAVLGPKASHCLRPPYGATDGNTATYAAALGLTVELWTVDTRDWSRPGAAAITQRIIAGAQTGAVVLLHDGGGDRSQTVEALGSALKVLSAQGWHFAPLC